MLKEIIDYNPNEYEFQQAVTEIYNSLEPLFKTNPQYINYFKILTEPDRIIQFKIIWEDDNNNIQLNRGFRVQFNSSLGPYKGGLRFNNSVNLSIMKFLGFEQIFKNALTGLPLGGAKGGSDFNPYGKSNNEIRRFCKSFMTELIRHIGPDTDIPAGDIGVGETEIGYLFGLYKQQTLRHNGALTGKSICYGGSHIRTKATGYGLVYFINNMLNHIHNNIQGKTVIVSGAGNVATATIDKLLAENAVPLTVSDITGIVYAKNGFTRKLYNVIYELYQNRKLLNEFHKYNEFDAVFIPVDITNGESVWTKINELELNSIDIALTCATQNEINKTSANNLINLNVQIVAEGSNMGCDKDAIQVFNNNNIFYAGGKMANGGGVCVSQFEMQQNASKSQWEPAVVDKKLKDVMKHIFDTSMQTAQEYNVSLTEGANILSFLTVVEAMEKQGYLW